MSSDFTLEPPDPHGAAGPNGIIQVINTRIAYWDKTGRLIWGPMPLDGMFSSVGNTNFSFDPRALYDAASGHFYVVLLEQDTANQKSYVNVAVSKGTNPASNTPNDWFLYRIDNTRTVGTNAYWGDYPGLGFDRQAVYIRLNMYTFSDVSGDVQIIVLDKASLITGTANPAFVFTSGGPGAAFTLQPCTVHTNDPGNVAYFGETILGNNTQVRIWALSDPLGARTLTSTIVTVPDNGGFPPFTGAPQAGTGITIDTLDGRTQGNAFWHDGSIWFCHTAGGSFGKALVYYYRIDLNGYPGGTPTLGESGSIDGGPGEWTYQPSIGANPKGDVCLVYSQSSLNRFPTIMATTHPASAFSFETPTVIKASPSFYFGGRWGDYGSVTPDPTDDTFWVTHEWARSSSIIGWGTWWANVLARLAPNVVVATNLITGGNGNGLIDVNECNDLFLVLTNIGSLGATNVQVTLTTTTPGVALGARSSSYPDLPVGEGGTNLVKFSISTAPFFICGRPIDLALVIKSDQVTTSNTFALATGRVGTPARFDSTGPVAIPDANVNGTNSTIVVSNVSSAISKVTVSLYLTHTFDADLSFELIGPDGTTIPLSANHGGSGDNYGAGCSPESFRTTFDDASGTPISSAFPPFVGTFKPDFTLSAFAGKFGTNVNGAWKLHLVDNAAFDVGTLHCWSLFVSGAQCLDGGGTCPGADLALGIADTPDPVFIGSNLVYTVSVTNNGPSAATNVVINHFLPSSVVFVSAVASQGNATHSGGTVVGSLGAIPFSGVATMTVLVTPTTAGTITSGATVSSNDTDPDPSNNSATTTTRVNPATSDLAVGILDAPDPALVGGALTYTVSVTNNGPSTASSVTVTNTLPLSVIVNSATASQGIATINGSVVVCSFGTLTNGGRASAAINVTPTAQGTIVATAVVEANQVDPITANNTATASTTVGPAADLSITMIDTPDPVVVRSNWAYVITVTNHGPNNASGVVLNQTLPANVSVVSSNTTQGTISLAANSLTADLGTLTNGRSATVTVIVTATNSGLYSSTATVTGSQGDPNSGNNSASASTTVAPRNVSIVAAGATLTAESLSPPNGALDLGETVTVQLRLRNAGNVPNTNLVATLLATGGVTSPSGPQTYGVLTPSDFPVGKPFTFTASGTNGGTVVATLQLQDGGANLGPATFSFALPNVQTFANINAITIVDASQAAPYPSTNTVSGVVGLVGNVTVTLSNLNHTFPDDVDVLLVGPNGTNGPKVILMSDAGGANALSNVTIKLDDAAPAALPDDGQILSASYKPSDFEPGDPFDAPAPAGPYGTTLSSFAGANPNGVWSLYVMDDTGGDSGNIANGWSLAFTTISPVNQLADLGLSAASAFGRALVAGNLTCIYTVTNSGPNAATFVAFTDIVPAGAVLVSATPSQGSLSTIGNTVSGNLGGINAGGTATVTVVVRPTVSGSLTNTASVTATEIDLNPANNTASVVALVNVPIADAAVSNVAETNSIVIGSNVTFTLSVMNNGPEPALNIAVTDPLPAGLGFVGTSASSFVNSAGTITANLGDLSPGAAATFTITATATSTGTFTNVASVSTTSSDTNAANNSFPAEFTVTTPAPRIVAAGAILTAESLSPPNVTVDVGETVTLSLSLQNVGSADTANLQATLAATGGVTLPSGPQIYGALAHGGAAVARPFTFTATGTNGGAVVATLQLQDGANNLGTLAFVFNFPATIGFTNPAAIAIPDHGGATPYPSTIDVTGVTGKVGKVTVSFYGVTHAFPDDLDILLVGPTGRKLVLMSDAGGGHTITNLTLTFDDAGPVLPDSTAIEAGTYAPMDYEPGEAFPPPAPAGALGSTFAVFNGTNPEGTWSLYVVDDATGDAGSIAGGWSLSLTLVDTVNPTADLVLSITDAPDPIFVGSGLTYSVTVTNNGPVEATGVAVTDALPGGLNFVSASSSQGSVNVNGNIVTGNLGALTVGGSASVSIRVAPSLGGQIVNSVSVSANETDLSVANNTASTATTVIVPQAISLTSAVATNGQFQMVLTGEPGLTYVVQASTNLVTWVPVGTNTTAGNGAFKFTDVTPNFSRRFYRAIRLIP